MQHNSRKIYIKWFLVLILPPILFRLGGVELFEELAVLLTIITKFGLIILTIWYGLKVGIKNIWAFVLGLSTLIPLMPWISMIILLTRKVKTPAKEKKPLESRPTLSIGDVSDKGRTIKFIEWFIKNEPLVSVVSSKSLNVIFDEGITPRVSYGYNPEKSKDIDCLLDWFMEKTMEDIENLATMPKAEFKAFMDRLVRDGTRALIISGELGIKHDLNLKKYTYEKEIKKIPAGKERELFKKNFLNDNIIGAELRILGWLYHEWFAEWYKAPFSELILLPLPKYHEWFAEWYKAPKR